jgi:ribosomal RNA-processing protein 17
MGKNMKKNRGGNGKGGGHHKGKPSFANPNRHKKVEVAFNASDRLDYLTGFSKRKKERRAFGLAMQKVKDREAKVEERKERREAQMEKIADIERNKKALRKGLGAGKDDLDHDVSDDDDDNNDDDGSVTIGGQHEQRELLTFQDEHTTTQFGGLVSVTTTFGIPPDDDDDDSIDFYKRAKHGTDHVDTAQKRAADVNTFMAQVKSKMPKKNSGKRGGKKGQHGASTMSGMGNAATLKMAQKTLKKFNAKKGKRGGGGLGDERGGGKGGKKRKGRR